MDIESLFDFLIPSAAIGITFHNSPVKVAMCGRALEDQAVPAACKTVSNSEFKTSVSAQHGLLHS